MFLSRLKDTQSEDADTVARNDRSAKITASCVPLVLPCIQRLQGEAEKETREEEEGDVKTVGDRRVGGLSGCGHNTAMLLEETGTSCSERWRHAD